MTLSVIIPSYRRAEYLRDCLKALEQQERLPEEVLVVRQTSDEVTEACLASFPSGSLVIRQILVAEPGLIAALRAGLNAAKTELVVFTDDDTTAPPSWLATIERVFAEQPNVGAVGGKDVLTSVDDPEFDLTPARRVGQATIWGRTYGNHHRGSLQHAPVVHVLKGANMAYRTSLIQNHLIGAGLRGSGAQVGTEWGLGWEVRRQGFLVVYHADVWVYHHDARRAAFDDRGNHTSPEAMSRQYNEGYCLGRYFPLWSLPATVIWLATIGSAPYPGVIRAQLSPTLRARGKSGHLGHWFEGLRAGLSCRNATHEC